jgi:hypothetical protein
MNFLDRFGDLWRAPRLPVDALDMSDEEYGDQFEKAGWSKHAAQKEVELLQEARQRLNWRKPKKPR